MELDQKLSELARHMSTLQAQLAREEGQLETLKQQRDHITQACKERGVDPQELDSVVVQKRAELADLLASVETKLIAIDEKRSSIVTNVRLKT